jgi:DNA-binding XRE family transcriptional regulator
LIPVLETATSPELRAGNSGSGMPGKSKTYPPKELVASLLNHRMTGAQLRQLREAIGLTQAEMAQKIHVARQTLNRAEKSGSKRISRIMELLIERAVLKGELRIPGDE